MRAARGRHHYHANPMEPHAHQLIRSESIAEIRYLERALGKSDVLAGFIQKLENNIAAFRAAFCEYVARGDASGAARAAHTLKGSCGQLGAHALSELFGDIESKAKAGEYGEAQRRFDNGASLINQSLEALKRA